MTRTRDLPPLPNPLRLSLAGCESERFVASVPSLVIRPSSGKSGEERRASQSIFGSGVELAIRQTGPRSARRSPLLSDRRSSRAICFVVAGMGKKSIRAEGGGEGDGPCNCPIRSGKVLPMQKEQMTPGSGGIPLISAIPAGRRAATVEEDGDAMVSPLLSQKLIPVFCHQSLCLSLGLSAACLHRRHHRCVPRAYPLPLGGSGEGRGRSGPAPPCVRPRPCIIC